MDWRYFETYKFDRNELQVRIYSHKGTGTKMVHVFLSKCSIYQSFLILCLYANRCEPGVHSYQFYYIQSTSSPILTSLVPVVHLVGVIFHCATSDYIFFWSEKHGLIAWAQPTSWLSKPKWLFHLPCLFGITFLSCVRTAV